MEKILDLNDGFSGPFAISTQQTQGHDSLMKCESCDGRPGERHTPDFYIEEDLFEGVDYLFFAGHA